MDPQSQHKSRLDLPWLMKMAWRDSRRSRSKLFLFTASIIMGIAALVALNSFGENLQKDIDGQAQELLGADLALDTRRIPDTTVTAFIDSLGGEQAREMAFPSMVFFPKSKGSRLVQVKALKGGYPFYGRLKTEPFEASDNWQDGKYVLADQTLMLQYNAQVGDTIRLGRSYFIIKGKLLSAPGQNGMGASVAPTVYMPLEYISETGLVQFGSRVTYNFYFKFEEGTDVEALIESKEDQMDGMKLYAETIEDRKESLGRAFGDMAKFLNLVAFVALLLGCVGVASAVHVYIKDKISTVAILRCLGASGQQAFMVYLIQIAGMGLIGSLIGAGLGALIQLILPEVMAEFLPFEASKAVSLSAVLQGLVAGILIAILFGLLPLLGIRNVSPLFTLRASYEPRKLKSDPLRIALYFVIALSIYAFVFFQVGRPLEALFFTLALAAGFALLVGVGSLTMWLVRKYFPKNWGYLWRQSLANLYRPNNQTLILIVAIGLGTAMVTTMYFVQDLLIKQLDMSGQIGRPNVVLFDIQSDEVEAVETLTQNMQLPVLQSVPIVSMRLNKLKDRSKAEVEADSTIRIPRWVFEREYRVTYRDSLIDSEEISEGKWYRNTIKGDSIFISLDEDFGKRRMKLEIGDALDFNVQGAMIRTYVGSFRKIDWQRVQTNFIVVFPRGVLEEAPKFHVLMTRVDSSAASAQYQRALMEQHPTISVIDLDLILKTVNNILGKVSFIVQFMASFSIITGLLVLISSVIISKYQRIQESVLLRTLGASRRQILFINALEYVFLGTLAIITGVIIALLCTWALAYFSFETTFVPSFMPVLYIFLIINVLTLGIGLFNSRDVVRKPPLEVLRKEV